MFTYIFNCMESKRMERRHRHHWVQDSWGLKPTSNQQERSTSCWIRSIFETTNPRSRWWYCCHHGVEHPNWHSSTIDRADTVKPLILNWSVKRRHRNQLVGSENHCLRKKKPCAICWRRQTPCYLQKDSCRWSSQPKKRLRSMGSTNC